MISVEEALEKILSYVNILESEEKPLMDSLGLVLTADVSADMDIPLLDSSNMDGYAVQAESTEGASPNSPRMLSIIGEVAAGYISSAKVTPGTAISIMTGAPIPKGADAVVRIEDTDYEKGKVSKKPLTEIGILHPAAKGWNIRRVGENIAKGSLVLPAGTVLRPQEIGVLASLGKTTVRVIRRPVVAVLATGDELVDITEPLPQGKIYNSNTYSIAAQVACYGGIPKILGIARDNIKSLEDKMKQARDADLLITSAGVSVGEYDVVKDVLSRLGELTFWTVRMKPGKPLAFGLLHLGKRKIPHLGLPGNPVASMVSFEQFARPAILKMLGRKNLSKPTVMAVSEGRVENADGRRFFARVRVTKRNGRFFANLTGAQGPGILTSMAQANGLMIIPEDKPAVEVGEEVQVQMLDWNEEM